METYYLGLLNNRKSNRTNQSMFSYLHDHLTHLLNDQNDLEVIGKILILNIVLCPLRNSPRK
jgi:hypothetical protein